MAGWPCGSPDTCRNTATTNRLDDAPVTLPDFFETDRQLIDAGLGRLLPAAETAPTSLHHAMRYSVFAGGKRLRPILCLEAARMFSDPPDAAVAVGCALEFIHTYSLVHDDLPAMDDDGLRRGQPTCHKKFGEDVAILAGDGLYAEAFRHLLTHQRSAPEDVLLAAAELAAATGVNGMVGGQDAAVSAASPPGGAALRRLHELKTGRL